MAEPNEPQARSRTSLAVVYFTVFLDLLGLGIIIPFQPYWARELGASGLALGTLMTAYSGAMIVGSIVFGRLSDRIGRRPVLLLTLAGSAAAMVATAFAPNLLLFGLSRAVAGAFGGSISAAQAYIGDVTKPEERAKFMGFLYAAVGMGFVFGPAMSGGLIHLGFSFRQTALTAAALAAANLICAFFALREPRRAATVPRPARELWLAVARRADLWPPLVGTFLVTLAFVAMETTFAFFAHDRFGLEAGGFALTLVGVGVVMVVVQGGLIGPLSATLGDRRLALAGTLAMALGLFLLPLSRTLPLTLGTLGLLAAGRGLASPTLSGLISKAASAEEQGALLGTGQSLAATARATGPLIAGSLYDLHGASPYLFAGTAALLAAGLLLRLRRGVEEGAPRPVG